MTTIKSVAMTMTAVLTGLLASGCNSERNDAESKKEYNTIRQKIENANNPNYAVTAIRKYALENIQDLTDEEERIVTSNKPVIDSNFDQTQYAFYWKIADHHLIQVLTTPAPFIPLEASRTRRVEYP